MQTIDLNCDLGELEGPDGLALDRMLLNFVSSANIACGAHAGSRERMCDLATACSASGVAYGAHPGYEDRVNFGRVVVSMSLPDLSDMIRRQLELAATAAHQSKIQVAHVKPHGALYNQAANDESLAECIAEAVRRVLPNARLVGLAGSRLIRVAAKIGLHAIPEAFADRAYQSDGTLVPRSEPGAVLTDFDAIAVQSLQLIRDRTVRCLDGSLIHVHADSLCLHGDTPGSLILLQRLRQRLEQNGIVIAPPIATT